MIPQYEFSFAAGVAVACAAVVAARSGEAEPVIDGDGPVLARIWVIEGRKRVQRMWRVDRLGELNGKVWGWWHLFDRFAGENNLGPLR